MLAFVRPESCATAHASAHINLTRPAPARFGTRKRQRAASGRCYACDRLATGVAPVDAKTGGPWRRKQPPILRPACARHAWSEFQYPGAKRPAAAAEAPEAPIYLARSDRKIPLALSAGFEVYRHDTGEIVCSGCGPREARQYWHPLTGFDMQPKPEILTAIEAAENAVRSHETDDWTCTRTSAEEAYQAGSYCALEADPIGFGVGGPMDGPTEDEIVAAYEDFESMREAHIDSAADRAMAANIQETAFAPAIVLF